MPDAFVPELVPVGLSEAAESLKIACLYFDTVIFQHRGLLVRQVVREGLVKKGETVYYPHIVTDQDIGVFLESVELLVDEGVVVPAPTPPTEVFKAAHEPWSDAVDRVSDTILESLTAARHPHPEQALLFAKAEASFGATFMSLSHGCPVTPHRPIHEWYCHGYRRLLEATWKKTPKPEKQRHLRDSLAYEVLMQRLPSVSDLNFEDVLRLREKQRDNLLRFRAEMADLTAQLDVEPSSEEFISHARAFIENRIDPAVVELREQLADLRRGSWLKAATGSPSTAMVTMWISYFCQMSPVAQAALATAAAALATAGVTGDYLRRRKSIQCHPFALLLTTER